MLKNPHWKNCPVSVFPPQRIDWFQPFLPGGPLTLNLSDVTSAAKGDIRGSTKVLGCHQLLNLGETFNKKKHNFPQKDPTPLLPYSSFHSFPPHPVNVHGAFPFGSTLKGFQSQCMAVMAFSSELGSQPKGELNLNSKGIRIVVDFIQVFCKVKIVVDVIQVVFPLG